MELYASRHGETIWNTQKRLTGRESNSPLTEKGKEQAKQLGSLLKDIKFDAVYCSPLQRTVDTARIAFGDDYEISIDERLAELGFGAMSGMTYEEVSTRFPEAGMLFFTDPVSYRPPADAEELESIIKRISSFMDDIIKKNHKNVFVQTHGYVLRVLYACAKDKLISSIAEAPQYSNCDLVHYTYDNGIWKLHEVEATEN